MSDYRDTDFMTMEEFLRRLRLELHDPEFSFLDDSAPHNQHEYDVILSIFKTFE